MSSLLTNLGLLFDFLLNQMGSLSAFFVSNTLGQIILGLVVFSVVFSFLTYVIKKVKG